MSENEVNDAVVTFVVNVSDINTVNNFYTNNYLWMETRNICWNINDKNIKITVLKLYDDHLRKTAFSDANMLVHGCGVSQYPQFYDQHLEKYQLLPRPCLGSFKDDNREKW